jgi:hypothetical protein
MTKQNDAEGSIRSAAKALADAIAKGREHGLTVAWPNRPDGLAAIAISATGKAKVDVTVHAAGVAPETAAKASAAAQKSVDRVIEKAGDKAL